MAKTRKQLSPWIQHVMAVRRKHKGMSYTDAMVEAKASWKKHKGGVLVGMGIGAGRKKKGGALYGFAHGPYTESPLTDGAARTPAFDLSSMQWPGANPAAMTAGRRSRRRRRRS